MARVQAEAAKVRELLNTRGQQQQQAQEEEE